MIVHIECDSPHVVFGQSPCPVKVVVELTKDGIDGKSAYQIAKENGYTGTEEEFAQMLISIQDKQDKIEIGNPLVSLLDLYNLGKL